MQNYTDFTSSFQCKTSITQSTVKKSVRSCQDLGVGIIPWSPLARGFLARSLKEETQRGKTDLFSVLVNGDPNKDSFLADINERRVCQRALSPSINPA
ncbi:hypothetical protein M407DRAFT_25802 [Tulasnella calospora MUT 4182]|uniref:NADP-dependent oxidoreductase domain-containing protein n=1 Tax=Tulasnella calospora MUT 4182 TaxID=1051891 RepID=A0A0C3KTR7_9AGAM|nr:hypothetical protein M407DRAFT_25802 [Tulasnella calospora MUT 4182]